MKDIGSVDRTPNNSRSANPDAAIATAMPTTAPMATGLSPSNNARPCSCRVCRRARSYAELARPASNGVSHCGIHADRARASARSAKPPVNCAVSR